jgi:microcystin degradation protein MlrC
MKVFTAYLGTETNTFSPIPTGYLSFAQQLLRHSGEGQEKAESQDLQSTILQLDIFKRLAIERGWSVVESLVAFAKPAGPTVKKVYETFREEIFSDLKKAMPVDIVLLALHGAMVAEGYEDCEGDLLSGIREIVGPQIPIGIELDLHCHLTQAMVKNATALVTCKEYPHIDHGDRSMELFQIIADTACGKTNPRMHVFDCRMIGMFYTTSEPMKSFISKLRGLEGNNGVLSISVAHGFPWGDVAEGGAKMLVVTDEHGKHGDTLAEQLGREFFGLRNRLLAKYYSVEEGLDFALSVGKMPVVLADVSDNPGAGAPGDSTFLLQALLDRGIENAAVACIWDPMAVWMVMEAGEGAKLDLRIGGKTGPMSGNPIDISVTVKKIMKDLVQTMGEGLNKRNFPIGNAVAVHASGIDIVLTSRRSQTLGLECFTDLGIDPRKRRILVVKSYQHFYAAYAPIAARILYISTPGAVKPDFAAIPYQRMDTYKWPFVENPFG